MSSQAKKDAENKNKEGAFSNGKGAAPGNAGHSSSHGDSPVEVTPKDITPDDASWADRTERKIASGDTEERREALHDEAVDLTFPASDPIAIPSPRDDAKARAGHGKTQK
ncbi:MAG: hypothetical protein JWR21_3060 [Herminiimonas sp.]|nr:hypothetical protein [Herminiimonas sp.]MDB5855736.1 hypothetical protein [Herminiimonas sp.]